MPSGSRVRTDLAGVLIVGLGGCGWGSSPSAPTSAVETVEVAVTGELLVHRSQGGGPPSLCRVPARGGALDCDPTPGRYAGPTRPGAGVAAVIEVREGPEGHQERLIRWTGPSDEGVQEWVPWTSQVRDPALGPDGSVLVTHQVDGISVLSRIGGEGRARVLHDHPAGSFEPSWAGDGEAVVFAASRDGNAELYRLPLRALAGQGTGTSSALQRLTDAPATPPSLQRLTDEPADDMKPRVSALGRLAFLSDRGGVRQVWISGPGVPRPLLPDDRDTHVDLAFSPSGDRLAVVGGPSPAKVGVRVVHVPSGQVRARVGGPELTAEQPAWSPDGALLAVTCRRAGATPGVCVVRASDGELLSEIHQPDAEIWLPRWW